MKHLQKLIILFSTILLAACSSNSAISSSESSQVSSNSSFSSQTIKSMSLITSNLFSAGITEDDKLSSASFDVQKVRAHQYLFSEDMIGPFIIKNPQELKDCSDALKAKYYEEYGEFDVIGNYRVMYDYLDSIDQGVFEKRIVVLLPSYTLTSGSLSNGFDSLYLKDGNLYAHALADSYDKHPGAGFTMDMAWETFVLFIDKGIEFEQIIIIND